MLSEINTFHGPNFGSIHQRNKWYFLPYKIHHEDEILNKLPTTNHPVIRPYRHDRHFELDMFYPTLYGLGLDYLRAIHTVP